MLGFGASYIRDLTVGTEVSHHTQCLILSFLMLNLLSAYGTDMNKAENKSYFDT